MGCGDDVRDASLRDGAQFVAAESDAAVRASINGQGVADSAVHGQITDAAVSDAIVSDAAASDGAMDGGRLEDAADASTGPFVVRIVDPERCSEVGVFANPGEMNHLGAARLTPPRYPFAVTEIGYQLEHTPEKSDGCDATPTHRVVVFRSEGGAPPATPLIEAEFEVTVAEPDEPVHEVRLMLPAPLQLESGEDLYIAVQHSVVAPQGICVGSCLDSGNRDRSLWSQASTPPYSWAPLISFGLINSYTMFAVGAPVVETPAADASQ